jgi:hypothetical protein
MKMTIKISFFAVILVLSNFNTGAQIVVKVKPVKPNSLVVKPAKHKNGHIWRTGHWNWNKSKNKYVWKKACWVKENNGHHWIGGHWIKNAHGHTWVKGRWKKGKAQRKAHKRHKRGHPQ